LKDKYLYQNEWDSAIPSECSNFSETINEKKVRVTHGLFIYSPESIELDALKELGFTDGEDVFFITRQEINSSKIQCYKEKLSEWNRLSSEDSITTKRDFFESEGEIQKIVDIWQIIHQDEEFVKNAINLVFQAVGEKAIKKAKLNASFSINKDFSKYFPVSSHRIPTAVKVYIKNRKLVFKSKSFKEEFTLQWILKTPNNSLQPTRLARL